MLENDEKTPEVKGIDIPASMKTFIGTKTIKAFPMTKQEYNIYRGWPIPPEEDPNEEVYLVEYAPDSKSKPNHPDHEGYISMSPKHVFDEAYKIAETYMDRLEIEQEDLLDKINKLRKALDQKLVPEDAVAILTEQLKVMNSYNDILHIRMGNISEGRPSTLGQERVKAEFNPAKNGTVDQIKNKSAELIDFIETLRGEDASGELHRVISEAETCIETGCMYAVKANFTK